MVRHDRARHATWTAYPKNPNVEIALTAAKIKSPNRDGSSGDPDVTDDHRRMRQRTRCDVAPLFGFVAKVERWPLDLGRVPSAASLG